MIAGAQPPGGWNVGASHWAAIGNLAAAAVAQKAEEAGTMTDAALIAGLRKEVSDLQDRLQFSTKAIENREETISKLNARLDDQAAQIVDLQGKLDLAGAAPARPGAEATIKRLAKIEEDLRWAAERSEARVRQLEDWARENELNAPIEAPYYRPKKEVL